MKELLRSNDPVLISYVSALLEEEGIGFMVADTNMSVLEGSIGALPRRVLVASDGVERARAVLTGAGIGMSSSMKAKTDQVKRPGALSPATTLDDFLGGRISVAQPKAGHRAGSDAVWLQAAVPAQAGNQVLDAGAGVGVAGLCLLARVPHINVTAIDIDDGLCALAAANAARNGVAAHFRAISADLAAPAETLFAKGLVREGYDQMMANPPFHAEGTVRPAPHAGRAAAHIMEAGALESWIRFLATFAAPKGRLTLIHTPQALAELLPLLDRRFGAVTLFPLFPKEGEPALRVILQARKGSRAGLNLLRGLVMHEADGRYTAKAEAVLRHGEALELVD